MMPVSLSLLVLPAGITPPEEELLLDDELELLLLDELELLLLDELDELPPTPPPHAAKNIPSASTAAQPIPRNFIVPTLFMLEKYRAQEYLPFAFAKLNPS